MHRTENAAGGVIPADNQDISKTFKLSDNIGKNIKVTFKGVQKAFGGNDVRGVLKEYGGNYFIQGRRIEESIIRNIQSLS